MLQSETTLAMTSLDISPPYDTLLRGGTLIDGTGTQGREADLAIKGNRIAAMGDLSGARTGEEIDVRGKYLAPGFIDTHTHDDQACMRTASMEPKISQGVTTVVVGNCGVSLAPIDHPETLPEPINLLEDGIQVLITWSQSHPEAAGRYLNNIAQEWGCAERHAAEKLKPAGACYFFLNEEDLSRIIAHPTAMIGSDGLPMDEHPHPRLWGTFPRVIRRFAIEQGLFSIEEAIRKMTSMPADRFGIEDRGRLDTGAYADLVVFDPLTIAHQATFENPKEAAAGIDLVFVNGHLSWSDKTMSPTGQGRLLRMVR